MYTLDPRRSPGRGPRRELLAWFRVRLGAGTPSVPVAGAGGGGADACCTLFAVAQCRCAVPFAFLLWFGLARVGILVHVAPDL